MKLGKFFQLLIIVAALIAATFMPDKTTENLSYKSYSFLLADTKEKRNMGLSGRESLSADTVMLFSYDRDEKGSIWMKDMNFPIDVIWLNHDFVVIDWRENISPNTYPKTFSPLSYCRYFIEANQNFIRDNQIRLGDRAAIDFNEQVLNF
jgi:uncharacterized membrane protein (UPF0127 family)